MAMERGRKSDVVFGLILLVIVVCTWIPRMKGPLDLRSSPANLILATALAEGKGYRLLNEPGEIHAVQDPPLYPAFIAAHMGLFGTTDPVAIGTKMRISNFLLHIFIVLSTYCFAR